MSAFARGGLALTLGLVLLHGASSPAGDSFDLGASYKQSIRPLLEGYCLPSHSTEARMGELDLQRSAGIGEIRGDVETGFKVEAMLDNGQMPPRESPQPTSHQRRQLLSCIDRFQKAEATPECRRSAEETTARPFLPVSGLSLVNAQR